MDTGFKPKYTVSDTIEEIIEKYQSDELVDSDQCYYGEVDEAS